jgi:hypothetical protein
MYNKIHEHRIDTSKNYYIYQIHLKRLSYRIDTSKNYYIYRIHLKRLSS